VGHQQRRAPALKNARARPDRLSPATAPPGPEGIGAVRCSAAPQQVVAEQRAEIARPRELQRRPEIEPGGMQKATDPGPGGEGQAAPGSWPGRHSRASAVSAVT
jgi:hypothetical protein